MSVLHIFFKELNSQIYIDGKRIFQNEMMRIQKTILADNAGKKGDVSINRIRLFAELTILAAGHAVLARGVDAMATTMYPQGAGSLPTAIPHKQEPLAA